MRKTSQDGGDSTSITSGIENEIRKPGGILKTKRSSIKRKVQNFSVESDDAVIEPLLQKDKEKIDTSKPSAKFNLMPKSKTEATSEKGTDKDKLISDDKLQKAAISNTSDVTDRILPTSNVKENSISKIVSTNVPLHNHMNTNVFSNHDGLKTFVAPKSQILVEIDGSKHVGYSPSPLIFTTAKIHTDGETKHMEPVQMAPGPILSTIEVSVMKNGTNTGGSPGNVTSNISAVYIPQSNKNISEQDPKPTFKTASNIATSQNNILDTKIQMPTEKTDVTVDGSSAVSSSKDTKLTQPIYSPTNVKGNSTENKNRITVQHDAKTEAVGTSNVVNDPIKEPKKDKPEAFSHQENKVDLSKSSKSEILDLQRVKDTANASNSRQLYRQSIVLDKDDPISKSKPNMVSPPLINDSKGFTLDDKTKFPKSSANSVPITSVHTVSTNVNAIDSKTYASSTTTTALNKKPPSLTNTIANQIAASVTDSTVTNNSSVAVSVSASANKSSPTISCTNKTYDASTSISNSQNMSGVAKKVDDSITTAAAIKNTSVPNTTSAVVNKSSHYTSTSMVSNKKNAPTTNIAAPNKVSSPVTSIAAGNKTPFTSSSTTITGSKISNTITSTVAANKVTASLATTTAGSISSKPISSTGALSKTSATTTAAGNKLSNSKTTAAVTNKISASSSTSTAGSKISNLTTLSAVPNKTSAPITVSATGNKVSSLSTATTAATNKISSPVIYTTANKTTPLSATTTAVVNKTSPSNSASSGKPVTSTTTTLPISSNTSIAKPVTATSSSVSRPSNVSNYGNMKAGITNETSVAKSQVASTLNAKPASSTTTTKPGKVATVATTIATTSQHSTVAKAPTVTAAKSAPNKTIPQPATTKSTEITPKSSTSNEKPLSAKSNITSVSSTATTGISNVTSTASTGSSALASSTSTSASVEANKKDNSKSKIISTGSKNFKA